MNINVTFREEQNNLDMSVKETDIFGVGFGSGGGTTDYNKLRHKPTINGVILECDKSSEDLGLLTEADLGTKAPVVTKTNGADFLDGADMPMKSLVVDIEPQQDLHGYDAPWAGGNGKNLFGTDDIDRLHKNVTFKSETDSAGNRIGVKLTGAYSGETATAPLGYASLSAGSYIVSGGAENVQLSIRPGSSSASQIGQVTTGETTITLESATDIYLIARVVGTFTSGLVIQPMIRLASVTEATFAPFANICPITGWTGMNGSVVGKNWLPNNLTFTDGLRNDIGAQTASAVSHYSEPFPVRPNTLYRATGTIWISGTNPRIYFLDANKNWISRTAQFMQQAFTFTTPEDCYYIQVQCSKDVDLTAGMISLDQSAAVTPYNGNTFSISWETEAGTVYSGTVDPIKGTLTVDRVAIDMGALTWTLRSSPPIFQCADVGVDYLKTSGQVAISSVYPFNGVVTSGSAANIDKTFSLYTGGNYLWVRDSSYASATDFTASLVGQTVLAYLATPIVYTLTPTEIRSLLGENHVTVDAGSIESLVYCVDTAAIIERIDADLASLDGRVDTAQGDITSLETSVDKKAPAIYSTASGEIASISDGADDMPMTSAVATITPKQDLNGYDHPWVGGAGKNLLNPSILEVGGLDSTTGAETAVNTRVRTGFIEVPAGTYTLSNGANLTSAYFVYDSSGNFVTSNVTWQTTKTVTVEERSKLRFLFRISASDVMTVDDVVKPQLEAGSSATTYEPYENICPIEGYTGMSTTVTGKNLLNQNGTDTDNGYRHGKYVDRDGNEQTSQEGTWDILEYVPVKPSTAYTISGHTANNANGLAFYDSSKQKLSAVTLETAPYTFTTPADCYYVRCNRRTTTDTAMQIELGSSATDYEEYAGSTTTTVSWQTEAGTVYSGTVDAVSGKMVVDRIAKRLTVAENLSGAYPGSLIWNSRGAIIRDADEMKPFICNRLKYVGRSVYSSEWKFGSCINANGTSFNLWLKDSAFASLAEASAWLEQNETQICYYLASPIVHQLSPHQINTLYAQNHVWTDVGEVSITYPTDTKLYVDNLFASIPTASGVSF